MRTLAIALFLLAAAVSVAFCGNKQIMHAEPNYYHLPKMQATIHVDGVLDEPCWQQALKIDLTTEVKPGENIPAPVQTSALLAYTQSHLCLAIIAQDPKPDEIRANFCDRDNIWNDDWIAFVFDTFNDQQRSFYFCCNPFGIQADYIYTPSGGGYYWDGIWDSYGILTDNGYVIEIAIPFSTLCFQHSEDEQIWGFDIIRGYPRNVPHQIGAWPRDRSNNCYLCQADKLVGFVDVKPGKNIELDPTLTAAITQQRENYTSGKFLQTQELHELGLSGHWRFTNNLTLNGTVNPDFSNVEADIAEMNINRQFAIYYPEKRPFFLESADYFKTKLYTVHTRSLADPNWGVKITGKKGANTIGFFSVQDEITNYIFPGVHASRSGSRQHRSQGTVLRYRRDLGKSSNLGVMATDRRGKDYENTVGSMDGRLQFSKRDELVFQAQIAKTIYPDDLAEQFAQSTKTLQGSALAAEYKHATRNYYVFSEYNRVSPDFRADMGYMPQAGYSFHETGGCYKWLRDPGSWYTLLSLYGTYDIRRNWQEQPIHQAFTSQIAYAGPMQSDVTIYYELGKDHYNGKSFRANWVRLTAQLKPSGLMYLQFTGTLGDEIDYTHTRAGTLYAIEPKVELNLGKRVGITYSHEYEHLDVQGGRLYTANIDNGKFVFQFSRKIFLRAIVQNVVYNRNVKLYTSAPKPEQQNVFSQILFSYKMNPHTVFFLGYSDNYLADEMQTIVQTNRTVFMKMGYAWRP